jgi:tRNA A37 methylthiotransferase MiaB
LNSSDDMLSAENVDQAMQECKKEAKVAVTGCLPAADSQTMRNVQHNSVVDQHGHACCHTCRL